MKKMEHREGYTIVELSDNELSMIISCIGETLEALEEWEFETRTGFQQTEMRQFLKETLSLVK